MPPPRRNRRRYADEKVKQPGPKVPLWVIFTFFPLLALLAAGQWLASSSVVPTDAATLCRQDRPPPVVTTVVIDVTDGLTSGERAQVQGELMRIRDALPRFGMLEVHALGREALDPLEPKFSLCNPGRGTDMNELYQNPRLAEKRWEEGFNLRLEETLAEVVTGEVSGQSLILEAVKSISLMRLAQPGFDGAEKRLVLISDLLQHTPGSYSHYTSKPDYALFASTTPGSAARTSLQDVQVELYYIQRPRTAALQGAEHLQFWISHFERNGGVVNRVRKIFGD